MLSEYDTAWSALNVQLREIENGAGGLGAALLELESHQRRTGFIKDWLDDVERRTFHHPDDPGRFLRAQFNPKRALRFNGSGVTVPPAGVTAQNEGCFLCRANISWQQRGSQMGYEVQVGNTAYYAWMNPFPLLPTHVVIATESHTSQEWGFKYDPDRGRSELLSDLVALSARMPGYIGFYNGVDAGASIPGHMHLHFCRRPDEESEFPLERAARVFENGEHDVGFLTSYPVAVAVWKGAPAKVVEAASSWVWQWTQMNRARLDGMTGNFIVTRDWTEDGLSLYFVPRDRTKARVGGSRGLVGGLEILGEVVMSTPEERKLMDEGAIDYFALEDYLARVHTPMFVS